MVAPAGVVLVRLPKSVMAQPKVGLPGPDPGASMQEHPWFDDLYHKF